MSISVLLVYDMPVIPKKPPRAVHAVRAYSRLATRQSKASIDFIVVVRI